MRRCYWIAGVLLGVGLVAPAPAQERPNAPDSRGRGQEAVKPKAKQVKVAVSGMT